MGETIAVASGKGGVGKTSIVAGLATCLAVMGKRVLCIDSDIGLRNLDIVLGLSDKTSLDFADVLRGDCTLDRATVSHGEVRNLFLLNAPLSLPDTDDTKFSSITGEANKIYDYVFIDCAAGLGRSLRMSAIAADRAIVVTTPDMTSLRDGARTAEIFEEYSVKKIGLVVNRVRLRLLTKENSPNIDDAMDTVGIPLLGIVPEDERVITSPKYTKPLIMRAADGAALAYYNIARRLTGESVPLMKIK